MALPKPITEALKEAGRVVMLGLVSYLLTEGVAYLIIDRIFGTKLDQATKLYVTGIVTTGLRTFDKWLHEQGVEQNDPSKTLGLTRF